MATPKVFFVHLRRPGPDDPRTDPLYESGSFGCTKCHSKNLFHPRHAQELKGARLAFIQGGDCGSRLVFLTPRITVAVWKDRKTGERFCEAKWTPTTMPFKYNEAPVLVSNNDGSSDFPFVERFAHATNCPTVESGLSSLFRSRAKPLEPELAHKVIKEYNRLRAKASPSSIASTYDEALPYSTQIDRNREGTYRRLITRLVGDTDGTDSVLQSAMPIAENQAESRCGLSRRRHWDRRTRSCT